MVLNNAAFLNTSKSLEITNTLNMCLLNNPTVTVAREYTEQEIADAEENRRRAKEVRDAEKHRADMEKGRNGAVNECNFETPVSDVKRETKANGLIPTIITAKVFYRTGSGDRLSPTTVTMGIKAITHIVSGAELVKAIKDTFSSSSIVVRGIRWLSGELNLIKDVIINTREIKDTVLAHNPSRGGSRAAAILANLRFKVKNAGAERLRTGENGAILPISTIVLTKDEVQEIKDTTSKDIMTVQVAQELCRRLALMSIIVVEPMNEIFHVFMDDNQSGYDSYTFKDKDKKEEDGVIKAILGNLKR